MSKWMKRLGIIFVMVLAMSMLTGCFAKKKQETEVPETETETQTEETDSFDTSDITYISEGQDIVNILLVGEDHREYETVSRSDAMILLTIHRSEGRMTLTSFMRDTYVTIPGWGDNRLNAAYAFGGRTLLNETFMHNFGVTVDANIETDFERFEAIIDSIGGVDIVLSEEEMDNLHLTEADVVNNSEVSEEGTLVHLNGEKALSYSRMRNIGKSDFDRTGRQRKMLQAVMKKVSAMDTLKLMGFADTILLSVTSNLKKDQLISLTVEALSLAEKGFETHNIPEDAGYTSQMIDGMAVLVPDMEACRSLVSEIIGTNEAAEETSAEPDTTAETNE